MSRRDAHVIVLGSGAGGLAAGLAAAAAGANVTVLERSPWLGGTTAISGAGIWIPANPWAAAAGVDDSIDDALCYLANLRLGDVDSVVGESYVREGVRVTQSIAAHAGLDWQHLVGMSDYHAEFPGGCRDGRSLEIQPVVVDAATLARVRPDPYGIPPWTINEEAGVGSRPDAAELARRRRDSVATRGRGVVAAMAAAIERMGGDVRAGVGCAQLAMSGRTVIGVDIGAEQLRGPVVVATGGFERDPQLVASFLRGPVLAPAGPPTNIGDGLRMEMTAGAALGNMSEAWWCAAIHVPGEQIDGAPFYRMLFLDLAKPGGLVVDRYGRRFANEATNYNDFGRTLHDVLASDFVHPRIPSWFVFDAARHRAFPLGFMAAPEPDGEWLVEADTIAELAARTELPPDDLADTIARFNAGVATGIDEFGRGTYVWDHFSSGGSEMRSLDKPPFYAARVLPGCLGTKGGMKIDSCARVVAADGVSVIEGLFAAGNAAANPFGCAYPGPGSTVGPAVVFGTLAGENAAIGTS